MKLFISHPHHDADVARPGAAHLDARGHLRSSTTSRSAQLSRSMRSGCSCSTVCSPWVSTDPSESGPAPHDGGGRRRAGRAWPRRPV